MFGYMFIVVSSGNMDLDAENEFYEGLSTEEYETLKEIFEDYPITDTDTNYIFAGYLAYIVTGGLFVLMIKVWTVDEIKLR